MSGRGRGKGKGKGSGQGQRKVSATLADDATKSTSTVKVLVVFDRFHALDSAVEVETYRSISSSIPEWATGKVTVKSARWSADTDKAIGWPRIYICGRVNYGSDIKFSDTEKKNINKLAVVSVLPFDDTENPIRARKTILEHAGIDKNDPYFFPEIFKDNVNFESVVKSIAVIRAMNPAWAPASSASTSSPLQINLRVGNGSDMFRFKNPQRQVLIDGLVGPEKLCVRVVGDIWNIYDAVSYFPLVDLWDCTGAKYPDPDTMFFAEHPEHLAGDVLNVFLVQRPWIEDEDNKDAIAAINSCKRQNGGHSLYNVVVDMYTGPLSIVLGLGTLNLSGVEDAIRSTILSPKDLTPTPAVPIPPTTPPLTPAVPPLPVTRRLYIVTGRRNASATERHTTDVIQAYMRRNFIDTEVTVSPWSETFGDSIGYPRLYVFSIEDRDGDFDATQDEKANRDKIRFVFGGSTQNTNHNLKFPKRTQSLFGSSDSATQARFILPVLFSMGSPHIIDRSKLDEFMTDFVGAPQRTKHEKIFLVKGRTRNESTYHDELSLIVNFAKKAYGAAVEVKKWSDEIDSTLGWPRVYILPESSDVNFKFTDQETKHREDLHMIVIDHGGGSLQEKKHYGYRKGLYGSDPFVSNATIVSSELRGVGAYQIVEEAELMGFFRDLLGAPNMVFQAQSLSVVLYNYGSDADSKIMTQIKRHVDSVYSGSIRLEYFDVYRANGFPYYQSIPYPRMYFMSAHPDATDLRLDHIDHLCAASIYICQIPQPTLIRDFSAENADKTVYDFLGGESHKRIATLAPDSFNNAATLKAYMFPVGQLHVAQIETPDPPDEVETDDDLKIEEVFEGDGEAEQVPLTFPKPDKPQDHDSDLVGDKDLSSLEKTLARITNETAQLRESYELLSDSKQSDDRLAQEKSSAQEKTIAELNSKIKTLSVQVEQLNEAASTFDGAEDIASTNAELVQCKEALQTALEENAALLNTANELESVKSANADLQAKVDSLTLAIDELNQKLEDLESSKNTAEIQAKARLSTIERKEEEIKGLETLLAEKNPAAATPAAIPGARYIDKEDAATIIRTFAAIHNDLANFGLAKEDRGAQQQKVSSFMDKCIAEIEPIVRSRARLEEDGAVENGVAVSGDVARFISGYYTEQELRGFLVEGVKDVVVRATLSNPAVVEERLSRLDTYLGHFAVALMSSGQLARAPSLQPASVDGEAVRQLTEQIELMKAQLDERQTDAQRQAQRIDELSLQVSGLETEKLTLEQNIQELTGEISELSQARASEAESLTEKDGNAETKSRLAKTMVLNAKIAAHERTIEEQTTKIKELEASLGAAQSEITAYKESAKQQLADSQDLNERKNKAIEENVELREHVERLNSSLQDARSALEQSAGAGSDARVTELTARLAVLTEEANGAKERLAAANERFKSLEATSTAASETLMAEVAQFKEENAQIRAANTTMSAAQETIQGSLMEVAFFDSRINPDKFVFTKKQDLIESVAKFNALIQAKVEVPVPGDGASEDAKKEFAKSVFERLSSLAQAMDAVDELIESGGQYTEPLSTDPEYIPIPRAAAEAMGAWAQKQFRDKFADETSVLEFVWKYDEAQDGYLPLSFEDAFPETPDPKRLNHHIEAIHGLQQPPPGLLDSLLLYQTIFDSDLGKQLVLLRTLYEKLHSSVLSGTAAHEGGAAIIGAGGLGQLEKGKYEEIINTLKSKIARVESEKTALELELSDVSSVVAGLRLSLQNAESAANDARSAADTAINTVTALRQRLIGEVCSLGAPSNGMFVGALTEKVEPASFEGDVAVTNTDWLSRATRTPISVSKDLIEDFAVALVGGNPERDPETIEDDPPPQAFLEECRHTVQNRKTFKSLLSEGLKYDGKLNKDALVLFQAAYKVKNTLLVVYEDSLGLELARSQMKDVMREYMSLRSRITGLPDIAPVLVEAPTQGVIRLIDIIGRFPLPSYPFGIVVMVDADTDRPIKRPRFATYGLTVIEIVNKKNGFPYSALHTGMPFATGAWKMLNCVRVCMTGNVLLPQKD